MIRNLTQTISLPRFTKNLYGINASYNRRQLSMVQMNGKKEIFKMNMNINKNRTFSSFSFAPSSFGSSNLRNHYNNINGNNNNFMINHNISINNNHNNSNSSSSNNNNNSNSSMNRLLVSFPYQHYTQVRFMAVPKKKVSHRVQRRKLVRYDIKNLTNIITCKACGKPKLSHRLCEQVELCAKGGLKDHRSKDRLNSGSDHGKIQTKIVEEEVS